MAIAYYGTKLSENITELPSGFLVCHNCVIARTGFQVYKGKDLPQDECETQGIEVGPEDEIKVLRTADEVFKPASIASYQGATFTCTHPKELLTVDTNSDHDCGDVTNVRKGTEPLEDGNFPLLADIIVKDRRAIYAIKVLKVRELSCGYNYHLLKVGNVVYQVGIIGNHVALVESGRAGSLARINDAAPISLEKEPFTMSKLLEQIFGIGLQQTVKDAKPEEVGGIFTALFGGRKPAVAMDEEVKPEEKKPEAKDDRTPSTADAKGKDAKAKDEQRERMHKALDRRMDSMQAEQEALGNAEDEDDEQLAGLLSGGAGALKSKETDGLDSDEDDVDGEGEGMDEEDDEDGKKEGEAKDGAVQDEPSTVIAPADRSQNVLPSATDSAEAAYQRGIIMGRKDALKNLRPIIARSKDSRVRGAFDTALKTVNSRATGKSSYKAVVDASQKPNATAMDSLSAGEKAVQDAQAAYEDMRGKNVTKK